jgi:long-chain fatty acid transport protein
MKNYSPLVLTAITLGGTVMSLPAFSAGLQLMPGSPNSGTAGAGHAAMGLGAGSAWANPATMTLVKGQHIGFGVIHAKTDVQFNGEEGAPSDALRPTEPDSYTNGGNAGGSINIPSFSYVNSLTDDISIGFSFVVPYGNSLDYDDDWEGNNIATHVSMQTLQAMPSIAYRLNEQFSLGFGITANETEVTQELKLMGMDVELAADSLDYGWTLGGLYELNDKHRFGFVYRSQVDSDMKGDATIAGESYDARLNWENPASIVISGVHQVTTNTSILWDVGRTFYSAFETTTVKVDDFALLPEIGLDRNWKDANRYAIGTHYQLTEGLILQAGYSFDESTVDTEDRSADLPLNDIHRYTAGALYQATESTGLAFSLEYADLGKTKIDDHGEFPFTGPAGEIESSATVATFAINYQF